MVSEAEKASAKRTLLSFLWHGGSVFDAWFNCASNQVTQVLLTLPYSFAQMGTLSGLLFQIYYASIGCWTAYLIYALYLEYRTRKERENVNFSGHIIQWFEVLDGLLGRPWKIAGLLFNTIYLFFGAVIQLIGCGSIIYYLNDNLDKRTWTYIFGACCSLAVFLPSYHNYRIWSFFGILMTSYTAWYLTIAATLHGQVRNVKHTAPNSLVQYFTGSTNILYTFGGHAITVEIMHAMWTPQKFKYVYPASTFYVLTVTLPSAIAMYWAYGDLLLTHSNAFSLLPKSVFKDIAIILMLLHQIICFGFACTPVFFVCEKAIGVHGTHSIFVKALTRMLVVIPIWFIAIAIPFFGPINSAVGALLVSFSVYIIPALAYMQTYLSPDSRRNAVEKPPRFLGWKGTYALNIFVVGWVMMVGFGIGGWASISNLIKQIHSFGLFAKCFQCPAKSPPLASLSKS